MKQTTQFSLHIVHHRYNYSLITRSLIRHMKYVTLENDILIFWLLSNHFHFPKFYFRLYNILQTCNFIYFKILWIIQILFIMCTYVYSMYIIIYCNDWVAIKVVIKTGLQNLTYRTASYRARLFQRRKRTENVTILQYYVYYVNQHRKSMQNQLRDNYHRACDTTILVVSSPYICSYFFLSTAISLVQTIYC